MPGMGLEKTKKFSKYLHCCQSYKLTTEHDSPTSVQEHITS